MSRMMLPLTSGPGDREGHEGNHARPVDGSGDGPLVLGTVPRQAPGDQLASVGDEVLEQAGVLVVDLDVGVRAELAAAPAAHRLALATIFQVLVVLGTLFFFFFGHGCQSFRRGSLVDPNTASSKSKPPSSSSSPKLRTPAWP